jgi:hypothetical protein
MERNPASDYIIDPPNAAIAAERNEIGKHSSERTLSATTVKSLDQACSFGRTGPGFIRFRLLTTS